MKLFKKKYKEKTKARKTSQIISYSIEIILGRQWLFYYINIAAKLEGEEESIKKIDIILKTFIDQLLPSFSLE